MILIVDDKPENIFSLKSILDLHSFPVDTALSGEEALKKTLPALNVIRHIRESKFFPAKH